jgi:hypothetical protein
MSVPADLLATLPGTVAGAVHAVLPELRTCKGIDGPFDADELKRAGHAAPAVLIGILGARQEGAPSWPQIGYRIEMAAYIVTRAGMAGPASAAALAIGQALMALVPETDWGLEPLGPATDVGLTTLVTRETRAAQVHLASVTWLQKLVLVTIEQAPPVPLSVYASQAPDIGPDHIEDYELISGPGEAS